MTMSDDADDVVRLLEQRGYEVLTIPHPRGKCERCDAQSNELAFGACFVCAMWEDPDSTDEQLVSGARAAMELNLSFKNWFAGRCAWGKLVPNENQRWRISCACATVAACTRLWADEHTLWRTGHRRR